MVVDLKTNIGIITLIIASVSYGLYFRDIFRLRTKPHALTWLVWALLNGVSFLTQRSNGAGAGGWVTGFAAFASFFIFIAAIYYGEKNITKLDWLCLAAALVVLCLWYRQGSSTLAVALASLTFVIGFIPTLRKSIAKPRQETALTFFLNGLKFLLAITALDALSLTTALYPSVLVAMNFGFVGLLILRRRRHRPAAR